MPYLDINNTKEVAISEVDIVPESYRPLIFICVGVWGWVIVLSVMSWQRIDVNLLLHSTNPSCQVQSCLVLAISLTLLITFHIILLEHTLFTQHTNIFNHFGPVIVCYALSAALALLGPFKKELEKFLKCLSRLFFQLHGQVYFSDILVADILISFSGVFTGVFVKLMDNTNISYSRYVPFVNSIPYLIRLKQCLDEYLSSKDRNKKQLINAFKYISAVPVIFLSHYTKVNDNPRRLDSNEVLLWRLWFLSALFSSLFAFGWDLVMDWGLAQIEFDNALIRLRKDIHFSDPFVYILAVCANGLLRILKVFSHLHHIHPFCVDLSEIVRRWIWVIFRFKNEWIKRCYLDLERNPAVVGGMMIETKLQHLSREEEKEKDFS